MNNSRWLFVLVLLTVVLALANVWLLLNAEGAARSDPTGHQARERDAAFHADNEKLCAELQTINEQLRRMQASLDAHRPEAAVDESRARPAPVSEAGAITHSAALPAPPTVDPAAPIRPPEPDHERRPRIGELAALDDRRLERSHFLWTMDMVLDRYGPPDVVNVNDGCATWCYEWEKFFMGVVFQGGRALRTYVNKREN